MWAGPELSKHLYWPRHAFIESHCLTNDKSYVVNYNTDRRVSTPV